jgi:hypothetical protein
MTGRTRLVAAVCGAVALFVAALASFGGAASDRAAAAPIVLVGDQRVLPNTDSNAAGMAEAFQHTAAASGTATRLVLYLDRASTATSVVVGLYAQGTNNAPGALLAQRTIDRPVAGAWNETAIPPTDITGGAVYWIAVLAPPGAGTLQFRDAPSGGRAQSSAQTNLSSLPASWSTGSTYASAPLSAYAAAEESAATATPSATASPTGTTTPTATASSTPADTPSATATATPSATGTATATPTVTVTSTATAVPAEITDLQRRAALLESRMGPIQVAAVEIGTQAHSLAVNPVTNQVYAAGINGSALVVMDGARGFTPSSSSMSTSTAPNAVIINPVTGRVYVKDGGNTAVFGSGGREDTLGSVGVVAVSTRANRVYAVAGDCCSPKLRVLDGVTHAIIAETPAPSSGSWLALNETTGRGYLGGVGVVHVLDLATNSWSGSIPVPVRPWSPIAVNAETNRLYAALDPSFNLRNVNALVEVDLASASVLATVAAPGWGFVEGLRWTRRGTAST